MANLLEKIADALSSQQLQDWVSGKTAPTIKTENTVTVDKATLTTAGEWIVGGLIASAIIISISIVVGIKSGAKYIVRNSGQRY